MKIDFVWFMIENRKYKIPLYYIPSPSLNLPLTKYRTTANIRHVNFWSLDDSPVGSPSEAFKIWSRLQKFKSNWPISFIYHLFFIETNKISVT